MQRQEVICILILLSAIICRPIFAETNKLFSDELNNVIQNHPDEYLPIIIILKEQYNSSELSAISSSKLSKNDKRMYVTEELRQFSFESQTNLRIVIDRLQQERAIVYPRFLWIANIIGLYANRDALKQLNNHPDIEIIEYDPFKYLLESIDVFSAQETYEQNREISYGVQKVNAPDVWELGFRGQGIVIAVIDSGVNYNHLDLQNRNWIHPDYPFHGWNFVNNSNNPFDDSGHGTHCAGIIAGDGSAGTQTGIAPESLIMSLKVLNADGYGHLVALFEAIQFAVLYDADILSISISNSDPSRHIRSMTRQVMVNVLAAGKIIVAAAGNRGIEGVGLPASCPPAWLHPDQTEIGGVSSVVAVGATDINDLLANFSSQGPVTWESIDPFYDYPLNPGSGLIKPDLCAPGVNIKSLRHDNNSGYITQSGTSMATQIVAGVMALMLSKQNELSPEEINQILEETAVPLTTSKANTSGSGRVDAFAAIDAVTHLYIAEKIFRDHNNNIPEYGELVFIEVSIGNSGVSNAVNMDFNLFCNDPFVTLLDDSTFLPSIEGGEIIRLNDLFSFETAASTPHLHRAEFRLVMSSDNNRICSETFLVEIQAPDILVNEVLYYDPIPGGNNNYIIEPGEEIRINIPIRNSGGSKSPPLYCHFESNSPFAEIIGQNEFFLNAISINEVFYPELVVNISESVEISNQIDFGFSINSGEYFFAGEFSLFIGGIVTGMIGAGTAITSPIEPCPINIFYRSLRSQTVYTASELYNAGLFANTAIDEFGFYVAGVPEFILPDFTIRMKHTAASNVSAHDNGPFNIVYHTVAYQPQSDGWDLLPLSPSFIWNGTDNLLVDTAFSLASNLSNTGQIRVYDIPDGFRFSRSDNSSQIDAITNTTAATKPQAAFRFSINIDEMDYRVNNLSFLTELFDTVLNWEEPPYSPIGYNIYRNGFQINNALVTETVYIDSNLTESRYYYYVTAVYDTFESLPSHIIMVEFPTSISGENGYPSYQTKLNNAYPNPFNPSTNISFTLENSGRVKVEIFNIAGQKIITLCDNNYEAGKHNLIWRGNNDNDKAISSGVYLYRMKTKDYLSVGKVILMK